MCPTGSSGPTPPCRWLQQRSGSTAEEFLNARGFFAFADRTSSTAERIEGAEKSAVDFVRLRDRAGAAPSGGAQGVESAVVTDAGVGIGVDEATLLVGFIGEFSPGQGGGRQRCGDVSMGSSPASMRFFASTSG